MSMELREYAALFKKRIKTFWFVVVLSIVSAFVWQLCQPETYRATLLLNVGRSGSQDTGEYTYDDFYRLQADERFADTVVRWIGSPRIIEDVRIEAGQSDATSFVAKRLSSQMIEVTYTRSDRAALDRLASALPSVLNQYAESLNQGGKQSGWFIVIGSVPVVSDARIGLPMALFAGLLIGMFIGFWSALFQHYFLKDTTRPCGSE